MIRATEQPSGREPASWTTRDADEPLTVVVAPDSYKGTIGAGDAAQALAAGWRTVRPHDRLELRPMADGGEGTIEVLLAAHPAATRERSVVTGPDGRPVAAEWLLLPDGTAVVELARSSGLPLMAELDALGATTTGLGELLREASARAGVERLLVALGGSASTDGGAGALVALGAVLLDGAGTALPPGGEALSRLERIVLDGLAAPPAGGVICLVDVTAPLLGPRGAAPVFGPQKGATEEQVVRLEAGLGRWARMLGGDPDRPGTGAAGGTAYGLVAGWGAGLRGGASSLADAIGLAETIGQADLVVTGEGRFDAQSLGGKVVGHVLELARGHGRAVAVVAGSASVEGAPVAITVELAELAGSTASAIREPATWLRAAGAAGASRLTSRS